MKKQEYLDVWQKWETQLKVIDKMELEVLLLNRSRLASTTLWDQYMHQTLSALRQDHERTKRKAEAESQVAEFH
jgi:hypothetical protein